MNIIEEERRRVGRLIRQARERHGLKQWELGLLMSHQRTGSGMSMLERGKIPIDVGELRELAVLLECDFFGETACPEPEQIVLTWIAGMRADEV